MRCLVSLAVAACGSSSHPATGTDTDGGSGRDAGTANATMQPQADGAIDAPGQDSTTASPDAGANDPGPFPLGATLGPNALHLRVRADAAMRVEVDLYTAATGVDEATAIVLTRAGPAHWSP